MICTNAYSQWDREKTRYWLLIVITFSIYGLNQFTFRAKPPSNWNHFVNVIFTMLFCYTLVVKITSFKFAKIFLRYVIIIALLIFSILQFMLNLLPGKFDNEINGVLKLFLPFWTLLMYGILTIDWFKNKDRYFYQLVTATSTLFAISLILSYFSIFQLANFSGLIACLGFYLYTHYSIRHYWRGMARKNIELRRECNIGMRIQEKISSASGTALDLQNVLRIITDSALRSLSASAGAIFLPQEDGMLKAQCVNGIFPPFEKVTKEIAKNPRLLVESFKSQKIAPGEGIIGEVAKLARPVLIKDALNDQRIYQSVPLTAPIKTLIAAPIRMGDELLGVMTVINKENSADAFTPNDGNLMYNIVRQAAVAIKTAQLHKDIVAEQIFAQEMKRAQQIQANILPHEFPKLESIEVAAEIQPARIVGGDYYHFFHHEDERMSIAIGDISGKGFPGALVSMTLHTLLHEQAVTGLSAKTVMYNLNNSMLNILRTNEMIVTMIYGIWDGLTKTFTFSNSGHPRPLIFHANTGVCEEIEDSVIAIGIWSDISPTEISVHLANDDIIFLFTDGIEEAINIDNEMFGVERIKQFIAENSHLSARELSEKLKTELERFTENAIPHDDCTWIVLKVKE